MKSRALVLVLSVVAVFSSRAEINLPPNRGTELILLLEAGGAPWLITAMDAPSKWISQGYNKYDSSYDFIMAVSNRSDTGCKLSFTRYVMKDDYVPREEHFQAEFPYSQQARYPLFDCGYVIGFYRNAWDDLIYFDSHRLLFPSSSNQTLQPTAGRSDD